MVKPYAAVSYDRQSFHRDLRLIKSIIIHCSDSDNNDHDDVSIIREWHIARGFTDVGYHFFVKKDGTIQVGRPLAWIGAHCLTQNVTSIGICLSGSKKFTEDQFLSTHSLVETLMNNYKIKKSMVLPHNHFSKNKTFPNFPLVEIWKFDNLS